MTEKTLLVLAASRYQLDAIVRAKAAGYRVLTTDNSPGNPGHALAHRAYSVDTTNEQAILDLAMSERVDGVIAPCTDVAVGTAAFVAERLGLPGVPRASAQILTEKIRFRRFQHEHALPAPEAYLLSPGRLPVLDWETPWLVKPNRSSGSKGVAIVRSADALASSAAWSSRHSLDGTALVERFIPGTQHTCEGFLAEGRIAFALVTDRMTADPPHVATAGHRVPARLAPDLQQLAVAQIETIFRTLGVESGPFDCDFVATGDAIVVLEMTPRLGGNALTSLLEAATGIDIADLAVRQAVGDAPPVPRAPQVRPSAVMVLGVPTAGRLELDQAARESLLAEPWMLRLDLDVERGAPVSPFVDGRARVGEALLTAPDRDALDERCALVLQRLALRGVD